MATIRFHQSHQLVPRHTFHADRTNGTNSTATLAVTPLQTPSWTFTSRRSPTGVTLGRDSGTDLTDHPRSSCLQFHILYLLLYIYIATLYKQRLSLAVPRPARLRTIVLSRTSATSSCITESLVFFFGRCEVSGNVTSPCRLLS